MPYRKRASFKQSCSVTSCAGNTGGVGNAVVNVYINYEKKFAFVELRTVEEASNAMALDGIMFEGVAVRIRRPNDYNPAHAARLGPGNPNANLNLAAVNLTPGGMDSEDRVRPNHSTDKFRPVLQLPSAQAQKQIRYS